MERERGSKVIEGGSVIRGGPSLSLDDDDDYDQRRNQNEDSDEEHTQVRGFKRRQPLPSKVKVKAKAEDLGPDSVSMDSFKPKESEKAGKGFLDDDSDDSDTNKKELEDVKRGSAGKGGEGGRGGGIGRGRGGAVGSKNSESDSDDSLKDQVTRKISSLKKGKVCLRAPKKEGEEVGREVEGEIDSGVPAAVKAVEGKEVRAGHSDSDGAGAGAGGPIERRGMLKKVTKKRVAGASSTGAPIGDLLHSLVSSIRIL